MDCSFKIYPVVWFFFLLLTGSGTQKTRSLIRIRFFNTGSSTPVSTVQESRFWWWQVPGINRQDQEGKVEEEEQVQQVLHRPEVKQGAVLRCLKKKKCVRIRIILPDTNVFLQILSRIQFFVGYGTIVLKYCMRIFCVNQNLTLDLDSDSPCDYKGEMHWEILFLFVVFDPLGWSHWCLSNNNNKKLNNCLIIYQHFAPKNLKYLYSLHWCFIKIYFSLRDFINFVSSKLPVVEVWLMDYPLPLGVC